MKATFVLPTLRILSCMFLILISLGTVWPQSNLDRRVSIAFDRASPSDVFRVLAKSLDCELSLDQEVKQMVTVLLNNVTRQTALDAICESVNCRWRIESGRLIIGPLAKAEASVLTSRLVPLKSGLEKRLPFNMRFESVPVKAVLEDCFKLARVSYCLFGESASETTLVTIDVSDRTVSEAITQVLENVRVTARIMQTLDQPPSYLIIAAR
jgi:hypothetical protein